MRTQLETDDSQTPWAWFPQHLTFYPSFCNKGIISGSSNWALCTSFAEHSAQGGGLARHLSSHAEFWSTSVFVPFCRWYQLQYPVVRISSDPVPQLMSVGPAPVNEQPWAGERWLWCSETYGGGNWANSFLRSMHGWQLSLRTMSISPSSVNVRDCFLGLYIIFIYYIIYFLCKFQHVSMNYCKARTHLQAAYIRQEVVFGVHDAVLVTDATGKGVAGQNRKLVMKQPSISLAPDLARARWIGKGKGEEK